MQRLTVFLSVVILLAALAGVRAQEGVPTLVPPTPLPAQNADVDDALVSESALARIQAEGVVRIGILFNEPPFGELNIRGNVVGYDAALGRSIAEAWGVQPEFVQVTRQTALDALRFDEVDMLIAAQVRQRSLDPLVEFSQTYYRGSQTLMVRADEAAQTLPEMDGRVIGVVRGTPAEDGLAFWRQRTGVNVSASYYLTLDEAIVGLVNGEVDGIVGKRYELREAAQPDVTRVFEEVVRPEPYAIAVRRQDINMRNLINRTLQYLSQSGRMEEIHNEFFPARPYPVDTVPEWDGIGDEAPTPGQYTTDVTYPQQYTLPQVQASGVVRVAGIAQPGPDATTAEQRLADANTQLAQAMAARWGVQLELVPNSTEDPLGAVQRGEADLALGVVPSWEATDRVDFAGTYLLRGKRLMVRENDDFTSFRDLRGQWIGTFATEPDAEALARELAESVNNNSANFYTIARDQDAAFEMLSEDTIDVVFADSVRLLPHLEANPNALKLSDRCPSCDPWYTREYLGVAVPRNDLDFRLLVDYTLQELWLDGTLDSALSSVTVPGESLTFDVSPGASEYMGFALAG